MVVDDGASVERRTIFGIHGDPDNLAVRFEWSDEVGYVWEVDFTEQSLNEAKIEGNRIRMSDSLGEEVIVTVFQLEPASV